MGKDKLYLVLLGAPGAGKGTQAEIISKKYGVPMISTGNIIRDALNNKTELGLKLKYYLDCGKLVPDEVIISIVKARISEKDCNDGFILDGMPRTIAQARALDEMGIMVNKVVSIEVPDEKIILRLSGRRICEKCGSSYHITDKPSIKENICDNCGGSLVVRRDDNPEIIANRLRLYHEQTEPLKEFYHSKGLLKLVEGQDILADTTKLVDEVLNQEK